MAFEPFIEGGLIDINPSSNLDHRGVKSIAFSMEDPPPDLAFCYEWRLVCQLFYCPKVSVVNQSFAPLPKKRKREKERSDRANSSEPGSRAQILPNLLKMGPWPSYSAPEKIFPAMLSTTLRVWSSDRWE